MMTKSKKEKDFALVEDDGFERVWLFVGGASAIRSEGVWIAAADVTAETVIMPDELGDFRYASHIELLALIRAATAAGVIRRGGAA